MDIDVPRDRNGEFEPKIMPKYQNTLDQDIDGKSISMYAKGMSTSDFETYLKELYGIEVSDSTINRITDMIFSFVRELKQRR